MRLVSSCRFGLGPFDSLQEGALLDLPSRFECQTASDAAAFPASMNGFGRRPLPAAISSMVRPEATDRSWSVTGSPPSRSITVAMLDQEPVVAVAAVALAVVAHPHQHPAALQLLAGKRELQVALA